VQNRSERLRQQGRYLNSARLLPRGL